METFRSADVIEIPGVSLLQSFKKEILTTNVKICNKKWGEEYITELMLINVALENFKCIKSSDRLDLRLRLTEIILSVGVFMFICRNNQ